MNYLRGVWQDVRLMVGSGADLVLISLVAAVALTIHRYQLPNLSRRVAQWFAPALSPEAAGQLPPLVTKLAGALILAALIFATIAVLRRPVREFGLAAGRPRRWLVDAGIALAIVLPFIAWAAGRPAFQRVYPYFGIMRLGAGWFVTGLAVRCAYMFAWEFLFRGLILFGFERRVGPAAAIAASTLPFVLVHFGKPMPEVYGSVVAGVALGLIALRGRSFLPCWLLHFAAAAALDLATLAR